MFSMRLPKCYDMEKCDQSFCGGNAVRWTILIATCAALSSWVPPASADTKSDCRTHKDQEVAIKSCTELITRDPKDAAAYFHRGRALNLKGDTAGAIADFSKAIEIRPNYTQAYNSRGSVYASKGDYEKALADVTRAGELEKATGKRKASAEPTAATPDKAPAKKPAAAPVPKAKIAAPAPKMAAPAPKKAAPVVPAQTPPAATPPLTEDGLQGVKRNPILP
jgi:tetratricopeptide (TPR) repeat protein